jgi:hypothetical protein
MAGKPLWRRTFDAVERPAGQRLERAVQTEQFADAVGAVLRLRAGLGHRVERASRRALHRVNLPAASDVAGLREQLAGLDRAVRRLEDELRGRTGARMVTTTDPADLAGRVRRDVARNLMRARNGVKYVAGVDRPTVGTTPKQTVWRRDRAQLWRYRSDGVTARTPVLIVMSLVSRSYILDLYSGASFIEALRDAGFDVYMLDWASRTSGTLPTGSRTTSRTCSPRRSRSSWTPRPSTASTSSGTATAGCCRCCSVRPDRSCRCGRW